MKTAKKDYVAELISVLKQASGNTQALSDFLVDLLTPQELMELATRWQIVKQLYKGVPQYQIVKNLHVGIATVTRGSRELLNQNGGFNQVLKKLYD